MTQGILSALTLFSALVLQYTVLSTFPSPWREIALPLLCGIVIMYRVSLPLGAFFLVTAAVITYGRGLSGFEIVIAYVIAALMAIGLSSRVFARRSLIALGGFAFGTTFIFLLTKLLLSVGRDIVGGEDVSIGVSLLHMIFVIFASVIGVILLSLIFTSLKETFGKRFMQKDQSYEIQSRS